MRKRITILCSIIIACSFFAGAGFLMGTLIREEPEWLIVEKEDTAVIPDILIAVVNLDNGVVRGGEKFYYGAQLLTYAKQNYIMTSLEDARTGIAVGRYASYVIIPPTFSESVVSINSTPQKAVLEYAVSSVIKDIHARDAMLEIAGFEKQLNDNLGYLYLNSILDEFHTAQDNVKTVISNDEKDLEILDRIQVIELVEGVEIPELDLPMEELEIIDVSGDIEAGRRIYDEIRDLYDSALALGAGEYRDVYTNGSERYRRLESFEALIAEMDILRLEEGGIYLTGLTQFTEYSERYNEALEEKKETVQTAASQIEENDREALALGGELQAVVEEILTYVRELEDAGLDNEFITEESLMFSISREEMESRAREYTEPEETDPSEESSSPEETDPSEESSSPVETDPSEEASSPEETDPSEETSSSAPSESEEVDSSSEEMGMLRARFAGYHLAGVGEEPSTEEEADAEEESSLSEESTADEETETSEETDPSDEAETPEETEIPEETETLEETEDTGETETSEETESAEETDPTEETDPSEEPSCSCEEELCEHADAYMDRLVQATNELIGEKLNLKREELNAAILDKLQTDKEALLNRFFTLLSEEKMLTLRRIDYDFTLEAQLTGIQGIQTNLEAMTEIDIDEVSSYVEGNILEPIIGQEEEVRNRLLREFGIHLEDSDQLLEELDRYDPYVYLDENRLSESYRTLLSSSDGLEDTIDQHDGQYAEYVSRIREKAFDNNQEIIQQLAETDRLSRENVDMALEEAKTEKGNHQNTNKRILDQFIGQLPYTRLGSVEYQQAYEFMIDPVNIKDKTEIQADQDQMAAATSVQRSVKRQKDHSIILYSTIGLFILIVALLLVLSGIRYRRINAEAN